MQLILGLIIGILFIKFLPYLSRLLLFIIAIIIGKVGVIINRKWMFTNYAKQYLKHTKIASADIYPILTEFINSVEDYSKENNFKTEDETEFIAYALYSIIVTRYPIELPLVERPNVIKKIELQAVEFACFFASKHNLGICIK